MTVFRAAFIFCVTILMATSAFATEPVRVGSKAFTESVILGELATQLGNNAGIPTIHRSQLGGTRVLWEALLAGQIDIYPEYTGTIIQELIPGTAGRYSGDRGRAPPAWNRDDSTARIQ